MTLPDILAWCFCAFNAGVCVCSILYSHNMSKGILNEYAKALAITKSCDELLKELEGKRNDN